MVTHDMAEAVRLADRELVIEDGQIALDHRIDLARPRERGSPEVAAFEGRILRELFRNAVAGEDAEYRIPHPLLHYGAGDDLSA